MKYALAVLTILIPISLHAQTSGLVANYTFDNGTASDSVGGNNGTILGATAGSGKVNGGMQFSGSGAYIDVGSTALDLSSSNAVTVAAWVNIGASQTAGSFPGLVAKGDNSYLLTLASPTNTRIKFAVHSSVGAYPSADSSTVLSPNTWYHVVGVYNGSTIQVYINGVADGSATNMPGSLNVGPGSTNFTIGKYGADYFKGLLDEIKIYNRALSAAEISGLYTAESGATAPPPVVPDPSVPPPPPPVTPPEAPTSGTYYIDFASGNDSNSGTQSSPWKHAPGDPNATGNARSVSLHGGDMVMFKGGVRYEGGITIQWSGSSGNPIRYKGDGWGGKALLDGSVAFTNSWTRCSSASECYGNPNYSNIWYAAAMPGQTALNTIINNDSTFLPFAQDVNPEAPVYFDIVSKWRTTPSSNMPGANFTESSVFTQSDPNFWNDAYLAIHKSPNAVAITKIISYSPSSHTITLQSPNGGGLYEPTPYAILGHPVHIDYAGEYGVVGGKMYLWPPGNGNPNSLSLRVGKLPQAILIAGQSYVTIEGFKIQGYYGSDTDTYYSGGAIGNNGSGSYFDINFLNNDISFVRSITQGPVLGLGKVSGALISGNTIRDSIRSRGIIANGANIDVINNSWERLGGTGIYYAGVTKGNIKNNKVFGLRGAHGNGISVYQGSSNILIDGNDLRENGSPITYEQSSNLTFSNNFVDATYGAINEWGEMSGYVRWINNTLVNHANHLLLNVDRGTNSATYELRNNIWDGVSWQTDAKVTRSNNIWVGRNTGYPAPALKPGEVILNDGSTVFANPAAGDYRLKSGSPAVNAGISLSSYISTDKDGTSRPQGPAWDIGAYEYTGAGASTPPPPSASIVGDFNSDGLVNSIDLSLMSGSWNKNVAAYDLNHDGTINTLDYTMMVRNWTN